jgi:hypothetical protein
MANASVKQKTLRDLAKVQPSRSNRPDNLFPEYLSSQFACASSREEGRNGGNPKKDLG